jgi:hypothetical protein
MSKTLLTIDTHAGIQDFLPAMWPHYERAGVDILGVERSNKPTRWPKPVPTIAVGEDLFLRYCQHKHPTLLPERFLDTIQALLENSQFSGYTDFCVSTWSVFFPKPLPPPPSNLVLHLAGGPQFNRGFTAPYLFHHPRWFDRAMGATILETGRKLISEGRTEQGADDYFFGLIVHVAELKWHNVTTVTMNSMQDPGQIRAARKAISDGAWWVGNVKNEVELANLTAP